ncbi:MAG TPA: hypothetical protein VER11_29660 [Polyangiaceae bacterium]|nr:hypothetical protein [Polyangiaceae bacterium]
MLRKKNPGAGSRATLALSFSFALAASAVIAGCASGDESVTNDGKGENSDTLGNALEGAQLPKIEPLAAVQTLIQRLPKELSTGENVAVHMKLPPPTNPKLRESLVRLLGEPESPLIVYSSDALEKLGRIAKSPGSGFFTTFLRLDDAELEDRAAIEKQLSQAERPTDTTLVFSGRTPIAITTAFPFDLGRFQNGGLVPLGVCPIRPTSELARWNESLLVTDPQVVQDPTRTNDACRTSAGNANGVWTFKHLMAELAAASGLSTHDFVVDWLKQWLHPSTVNDDVVAARPAIFAKVIQPWANASGVTATLLSGPSGTWGLKLSGPLNLDIAPFRLSAIVNRIDLGETVSGPSFYGGGVTSDPKDAGELRFVFGVQNLANCTVLPFSVIFEYGVPITGCQNVRSWARNWISLNYPSSGPAFGPAWNAKLENLTEKVVKSGAAPSKGNMSALNQLRTNEVALGQTSISTLPPIGIRPLIYPPWELREFRLTDEQPRLGTDLPINGALRPHTVAKTPDDGAFFPTPNATVDNFVGTTVLSSVPSFPLTLPDDCRSSYDVPWSTLGAPFRGGNSLASGIFGAYWQTSVTPPDNREACARHEFSTNTCNGCHTRDTATKFLHVDPQTMPANLSSFLTGGPTGVLEVADPEYGGLIPNWKFADLERRFNRLYDIGCAQCGTLHFPLRDVLEFLKQRNVVIPGDPIGPGDPPPFEIGPVTDLKVVNDLLDVAPKFVDKALDQSVQLEGIGRPAQIWSE